MAHLSLLYCKWEPHLLASEHELSGTHVEEAVCCRITARRLLAPAAATVTDTVAISNIEGLVVGIAATVVTALYQVNGIVGARV
jgi:hypothetical protein